jgi:hypothetical protein
MLGRRYHDERGNAYEKKDETMMKEEKSMQKQ